MAWDKTGAEYRRAIYMWALALASFGLCGGLATGSLGWIIGILGGGSELTLAGLIRSAGIGAAIGLPIGAIIGAIVARPRRVGSALGSSAGDSAAAGGSGVQRWVSCGEGDH